MESMATVTDCGAGESHHRDALRPSVDMEYRPGARTLRVSEGVEEVLRITGVAESSAA